MDEQIILEEELIAEERAIEAARLGAAITQRPIRSCRPCARRSASRRRRRVRQAVALMNERRIGCVLVVDDGRLVGVFTERDVLTKVVAGGLRRRRRRAVARGDDGGSRVPDARRRRSPTRST